MKHTLALSAAGVALLTMSPAAKADDVLYDNLGDSAGFGDPVSIHPFDSFSTGASSETLSGLTLMLWSDTPTDGNSFTVQLFANATGNNPGSPLSPPLASIADSSVSTSLADYTVSLSSTPLLTANTRYWIGLSTGNSSSANWGVAADSNGIGVSGEFWNNDKVGTIPTSCCKPYIMEVTGTPATTSVPEPSTWAMMLIGFAGLGFSGYWSRRQSVSIAA